MSLLLPCMNSEADEWLDFMQCQRQFWPTMTTRHASFTAKLQLVLLGTIWQWPTGTSISVVGRNYFGHYWLEKKYWRALDCFTPSFSHVWLNLGMRHFSLWWFLSFWFLVLFGGVALVLFLVSHCLIPFSSHISCGVFQVLVEGHWTYSGTYVLVLRVSLRLFNLDCRYPRDQLQPARKKKTTRHASLAPIELGTFRRERRLMQSKHLWDTLSIDWHKLDSKLYNAKPTGHSPELYGTTSLSRSTVKIHFRNVSIRVTMRRMFTTSGMLIGAT